MMRVLAFMVVLAVFSAPVWGEVVSCHGVARAMTSDVYRARTEGIGNLRQYYASRGLQFPQSEAIARSGTLGERWTYDVLFILFAWPMELDPDRAVARGLVENLRLRALNRAIG